MRSKYSRSDVTTTDHVVGVNFGMGAVGGADDAALAVGAGSEARGPGGSGVGDGGARIGGSRAGVGGSGAGVGGSGAGVVGGGAGIGSAGEAAYADQEYESAA
jgi:hypothetical protein